MSSENKYLKLSGAENFRTRIVCSILTGKAVRIDHIRVDDEHPGLADHEISLLRLMEKISNGCSVRINDTGTSVKFSPGILTGGGDDGLELRHECPLSRGIGYFLDALLAVGPFGKNPLTITLTGITNHTNHYDDSVDLVKHVGLPMMQKFGVIGDLSLTVVKRGACPLGGGEVRFRCPIVKELKSINLWEEGRIKRVRGLAWATKCSPQMANRMVESARSVWNNFLADVYIYTDHYKGKNSGNSSGYGISLVVESTSGTVLSAELAATQGQTPEEVGRQVAHLLLEEIERGGMFDSCHQSLVLLYMLLCPEDVSKVRLGKLSPHAVQSLRTYRDFFGVKFKITPDPGNHTVLLSTIGTGYKNFARRAV